MKARGISKSLVLVLGLTFFGSEVQARDIISGLMKDSVATFFDAATLIYYSFRSNNKKPAAQKQQPAPPAEKAQPEQIKKYLRAKGLNLSFDSRPISRQSFAKTLIKRFKLDTSLSTDLLGWDSLYFSDAQSLGIFNQGEKGTGILSTRSMLKAFFKAKKASRVR